MTDMIRIDIAKVLHFYDECTGAKRHSNSIKAVTGEELGLALLLHYLNGRGDHAEILPDPCNTGNRSGNRLDAWLRVTSNTAEMPTYYQVEVKSWSIHGVGGNSKPFLLNATPEQSKQHKTAIWNAYWRDDQFVAPGLKKIFTEMKKPLGVTSAKALACLWDPLHPHGAPDPFFSWPTTSTEFPEIWVFSGSAYLRSLYPEQEHLGLKLPDTAVRLNWLKQIFPDL